MKHVPGWKVEFAPGALDLEKAVITDHLLKKDQEARMIKKGNHRIVERIRINGVDIHAKTNFLHNIRAKLRRILRPSKAQLEFSVLRELGDAGIKSLEPLAWAENSRLFGESILYTRTIGDSETLEEVWKSSWTNLAPNAKHIICKHFGILLAQMHKAGLFHQDPHPGNILLIGQSLDLRVIDLHNPIRKKNPTAADRQEDIASWAQWGSLRLETGDLATILIHYLRASQLGELKTWWNSIATRTIAGQRRFWAGQEPLCLHSGHRRFKRIRAKGLAGMALAEFCPLADKVRELFSKKGIPLQKPTVLKSSPSSQVYQSTIDGKGVIIKVIPHKKGIKGFISYLFGLHPAKKQWYWSNALRLRLLSTPRILGWYRDSLSGCGFVFAEELTGARQLDHWLDGNGKNFTLKQSMIRKLARTIRILHQRGISNRDMKAANIMVDCQNSFQWVDLGGMSHLPRKGDSRRFKDLARLAGSFWNCPQITQSDRLRFLLAYLDRQERRPLAWKRFWKCLEAQASERIAKRIQEGRPLG